MRAGRQQRDPTRATAGFMSEIVVVVSLKRGMRSQVIQKSQLHHARVPVKESSVRRIGHSEKMPLFEAATCYNLLLG